MGHKIDETIAHLGVDSTTKLTAKETIVPSRELRRRSVLSLESLPRIRLADGSEEQPELRLSDTLGEGGMGIVRGATQLPLGREVAVKTLRKERATDIDRQALLQEAWVIGSLEHPNIVPIYTLGRSDDDEPLIVMKRIEGRSWRDILDEDDRSLSWHLDLLLQVCRALEYAHNRGIVHRDLKPANVMRGSFGEVYLLDWGVAVSIADDGTGRLPLAVESHQVAGTPQYMAPEMTIEGGEIDERTDVYLLGAVLHELITGKPRHEGASLSAVLVAAYQSLPYDYGPETPPELAELCWRATAREPEDRYPTVADFRQALEEYLERRSSYELAHEARRKLEQLREETGHSADDDEAQARVRDLFGQCQFGFDHALKVWPENPEALSGRREAFATMAQWELESDNVAGAAALLGRLESPPAELAARVAHLRAEQESREAELLAHRRDRDMTVGSRSRVLLGIAVALFFSLVPFVVAALLKHGIIAHPTGARSIALSFLLLAFVGGFKLFGPDFDENLINRRILNIILFTAVCLPVARIIGVMRGIDMFDVLALEFPLFALTAAAVAMVSRPLMYAAAGLYLVGGVVTGLLPDFTLETFGVVNGLVGGVMVFGLRAPEEASCEPPQR